MKHIITLLLLLLLFSLSYGQVTFNTIPLDKQLLGRDLITNKGSIIIEGEVNKSASNYNSIQVEVYRDNILYNTSSHTLNFTSNIASFNFDIKIDAELVNYSVKIFSEINSSLILEKEIDDIVAGDVYIIQGQSNAEARKLSGVASANGFIDPFIRVYANGTNTTSNLLSNDEWYIGQGDGSRDSDGNTGQWGLKLANSIVNTTNIPVAIFNGAVGGKEIDFFKAPSDYQTSQSSNYGKMYYRLTKTGLKNYVRSVLWSQGEHNAKVATSTAEYKNEFIDLKNSWLTDYPNIEHFYIFQTKNGCYSLINFSGSDPFVNLMQVKEAQRQLAYENSDISIMSTASLLYRSDYCHFLFAGGYESFADRIFALINRDLYGTTTSDEVTPPMITDAYLQNNTTLIVETDAINLEMDTVAENFELTNAGTSTITNINLNHLCLL